VKETPVATAYTLEFVLANLPDDAHDILEVGCGEGELAQRLGEHGLAVTALDSNRQCIERTQARGVDSRLGEWPIELGCQFDAVLFTRSLHHVHDLERGVAAARRALRAGGRLIVEDSRIEGGLQRSSAWFTGLARTLFAAGACADGFDLDHVLAKLDFNPHEHGLHASTAIGEALRAFGTIAESDSAYYFRYLEPDLRGGAAAAEALLGHELELIAAGCIDPLGKRFVAWDG
jgi:SAM-dependent methyltransferase